MNNIGFDWTFPYPSQRMPVLAENVVATSQPLAAQAGLTMLHKGGNAVDAAVATAIALTVVEPTGCGIGSDAFAMVWDGGKLYGLNGSGRSPRAWNSRLFENQTAMPRLGWGTVTIPGAVDAWYSLSRRFGRLPFADLFEPAIHYAEKGYLVSPHVAAIWSEAPEMFRDFPEFQDAFLPGARAPLPGERFRQADQARTLYRIAVSEGESFYRGDLASEIVRHAQRTGGLISEMDLAEHHSDWVEPIGQRYRGVCVHEIPPNGQGLAALIALGILEHLDLQSFPVNSAESIHLQIEAMKVGFAEAHHHIADPQAMSVDPRELLCDDYLSRRARRISLEHAATPLPSIRHDPGTVYLATADADGMMVSFIQSNYHGFGSGIVIPGTGISLQSRGTAFSLEPNHPNQVGGGKRPFHTIIPGFVASAEEALACLGVMGAHMQPQGHVQMMVRLLDYAQNPQTAIDAPRWQVCEDGSVALETGFPPMLVMELERRGHSICTGEPASGWGGAQMIARLEDGLCGASDPRKDGLAVGY